MIKIECDICEKELDKPGALLFAPPISRSCDKSHFCRKCFNDIAAALSDLKDIAMQDKIREEPQGGKGE